MESLAVVKRRGLWVVCALLALTASFQTSGLTSTTASRVAAPPSVPKRPRPAPPIAAERREHATSAAEILERDPFDARTGPRVGPSPADAPKPATASSLYADPPCQDARVLLIAQADDPTWSFAALAGRDGKAILRRQGDLLGELRVHHIGWDRVWLSSAGSRCQIVVGERRDPRPGDKLGQGAPSPSAPPTPPSPHGQADRYSVPPEIAAKIQRVSATEFNVERSAIDMILENQAVLMRSARVVPEREGDRIVGVRLVGVRPGSLLGTLGLQNGDRLSTINGFELTDPQKALEAYARLRTANHLTVSLVRDGRPMSIDVNIR